jgi:hypothetical protein
MDAAPPAMKPALDGGQRELKVEEWAVLICLYAAQKIGFQEGKMTREQIDTICIPYMDCSMDEIQELRRQIVVEETDEACRKLLAPVMR